MMSVPIEKPSWDANDKEKSLEEYASWINNIARGAFLEAGHHPQMLFFVTEAGEIKGCQFREDLPRKKRDATIQQQSSQINPFGTIQILMTQIQHPKLTSHPRAQQLRFAGGDSKDLVRDCLLVIMLSRTGKEKAWANSIVREGDRLVLAEAVEAYSDHD